MAIPILLLVSDKDALRWIVIALCSIGVAIRGLNYALMQVAVVSAVLIAVDVTHPTDYGSEGRKVRFTFIGVAIGVLVALIADRLQKHAAKSAADSPARASPAAS